MAGRETRAVNGNVAKVSTWRWWLDYEMTMHTKQQANEKEEEEEEEKNRHARAPDTQQLSTATTGLGRDECNAAMPPKHDGAKKKKNHHATVKRHHAGLMSL